jgi:hypothetical protein
MQHAAEQDASTLQVGYIDRCASMHNRILYLCMPDGLARTILALYHLCIHAVPLMDKRELEDKGRTRLPDEIRILEYGILRQLNSIVDSLPPKRPIM